MDNRLSVIQKALWDFNIPPTYLGSHYLAYAELLVLEDPNRLTMATKWLYPEVASHYHTSWKSVERNIRTVISICWERDSGLQLEQATGAALHVRPSPTGFIQFLARYFLSQPVEFWNSLPAFPEKSAVEISAPSPVQEEDWRHPQAPVLFSRSTS